MNLHRLSLLVELSRRGTMTAVARATGYGTSAISQQLAVLEQEVGVKLVEPDGRRVRITPAGRRLLQHADGILAAVEAARVDLREPDSPVRVASFASAISAVLLPVAGQLAGQPRTRLTIEEREPDEVVERLQDDHIDLGVVYDYSARPRFLPDGQATVLIGNEPVYLAVPAS